MKLLKILKHFAKKRLFLSKKRIKKVKIRMRLSEVKNGQKVKLGQVLAGHGLNHRLASMGLIPGTELTVINNRHPGPFVISVKNSRLILGRGIAHKITVVM